MTIRKRPPEPRHFTHGAGGAMADAATEASPRHQDHLLGAPHAQPAEPLGENETPDQLAEKTAASESRKEARLDESIEESFPASDPASGHHIT